MGKTTTPVPHDPVVQGDVAENGKVDMNLLQKIRGMKLQHDQASELKKVARGRKRPTDDNFNLSGKRTQRGPISNLKVVPATKKKPAKGNEGNAEKSPSKLKKPTAEQQDKEGLPEDEEVGDEEVEDPGELPEKEGQMSDDPRVRIRQCEVCYRIFSAIEKLTRHLRSHTQVAEAKCSLCNQNIKYRYNLKNHMKMCQAKMRSDTETETLKVRYPKFLEGIKACLRDPTLPMPDLDEGTPFQVDEYGFVTGFDDTLEIDLDLLIPNYNPNLRLEVVPDEEPNSDEDGERVDKEKAGAVQVKRQAGNGIEGDEDDDDDGEDDDDEDGDSEDDDFEGAGSSRDISQ